MSYGRGTEQRKSPAGTARGSRSGSHDRPLLRADAERLENLDHAGGTRASLHVDPGQHPRRRQFKPEFLAISPNNRIPAIVDHARRRRRTVFGVRDRRDPDLSRREDRPFLPRTCAARSEVIQWVMWQMGGLGPMLGQHGHFALYAPEKIPYAIERYRDEAARLYRVLDLTRQDRRLCRRRRLLDRRHRLLSLDHDPQGAGFYARRLSERQALVCGPRPAAGAGGAGDRQVRQGAVRRGGAQEHVRAEGKEMAGGSNRTSLIARSAKRRARTYEATDRACFASRRASPCRHDEDQRNANNKRKHP